MEELIGPPITTQYNNIVVTFDRGHGMVGIYFRIGKSSIERKCQICDHRISLWCTRDKHELGSEGTRVLYHIYISSFVRKQIPISRSVRRQIVSIEYLVFSHNFGLALYLTSRRNSSYK